MITVRPKAWDREVDVVVLGTGGAAMSAAILAADQGAEVLMLEKSSEIGGTTAFSGGVPWIPMNHYARELGIEDSKEEALTYLRRLTGGKEPDPGLLEVYVDNAHQMIQYLHDHTPLRFAVPRGYADYFANLPGGKLEGRSLDPVPFSLNELPEEWQDKIRRHPIFPPLTLAEGGAVDASQVDYNIIAERMMANIVTMGRSLSASLFKGVLDRGIQVLLETPGKELIVNDEGEVIGVRAEQNGENVYYGARKGVVIATGGFEWNQELVKTFLKGNITHPMTPKYNEGDGLIMAMEVGAALGNMSEAGWSPTLVDPTIEYEDLVYNQIASGRMSPNSIIVNSRAERFVNEGVAYNDMPRAMFTYDVVTQTWPNETAFMIFDSQLKDREMVLTMFPGEQIPDWVDHADSIHDLALRIGLDPDALEATIERFNAHAEQGSDPDFHRGTAYFESFLTGGGSPEKNIGPINKAPFFALPVYSGSLGTNGGPRIDHNGQVQSLRGKAIGGLYSAGNASMGVMGPTYAGAGGTIGPALTFGYLAGRAVGNAPSRDISATIKHEMA